MFGQRHLVALDEKLRDRQMVAGVANHNLGFRLQLHQAGGLAESDRRTSTAHVRNGTFLFTFRKWRGRFDG